jgi:hypothetical protein
MHVMSFHIDVILERMHVIQDRVDVILERMHAFQDQMLGFSLPIDSSGILVQRPGA